MAAGGAAQQPAMPVVGFLYGVSAEPFADRLAAFRKVSKRMVLSRARM